MSTAIEQDLQLVEEFTPTIGLNLSVANAA